MAPNPQDRQRVGLIGVDLQLTEGAAEIIILERVLGQFEELCVVMQSVRFAFPVDARVLDKTDTLSILHDGGTHSRSAGRHTGREATCMVLCVAHNPPALRVTADTTA